MHAVSRGILKLWATKTRKEAYASSESSMIRSKWAFCPDASRSYYLTVRLKLPNVVGTCTWPAFWLAPALRHDGTAEWPPEIDIIDGALNGVEDTAFMILSTARNQNFGGSGSKGDTQLTFAAKQFDSRRRHYVSPTSMRGQWFEIGAEWTSNAICYFIDGLKTACENYAWVGDDGTKAPDAQIVINMAIGGAWAGRHGINDSLSPTSIGINHIPVYAAPWVSR